MITAVLIGAGGRGIGAYGGFAERHPQDIQFVAVADPIAERRELFAKLHNIPKNRQFTTDSDLFSAGKLADACFVCTQDKCHVIPTQAALRLGYHVFLEKPMATSPEEVVALSELAKRSNRVLGIGHVLRYTPFFKTIKKLIDDDQIGDIISIQHNENVGYYHQAHSYVRGNWRKNSESSPMILAKSCHDMDILTWLIDEPILSIASYGSLTHFTNSNKPEGAPKYCVEGCKHESTCPFFAPRIYLKGHDWLKYAVTLNPTDERVMDALKTSPYGRCVYQCDNDVVDHQVVAMEFAKGITVSFTMSAFTKDISRTLKVMGTRGEIRADMESNEVEVRTFITNSTRRIEVVQEQSGHGGGDDGIMRAFIQAVAGLVPFSASAEGAVISHLMAFAAEKSRLEHRMIRMDDYIDEIKKSVSLLVV